jgi:hypothetical protein
MARPADRSRGIGVSTRFMPVACYGPLNVSIHVLPGSATARTNLAHEFDEISFTDEASALVLTENGMRRSAPLRNRTG